MPGDAQVRDGRGECILVAASTIGAGMARMKRVGIYDDQVKRLFQDSVAPEIHALKGEMHAMRADIQRLDTKIDSMKGELIAEIRRLDARIDGVDRELRTAIDVRERLAALEARRA